MSANNRLTAGLLALEAFRKMTGAPYVFGGTWPTSGGTDCSGGVQWSYGQVGVQLARSTYEQFREYQIGNSVPYEVGDLIFIRGSDPGPNGEPGHVMMFVENGVVFQAPETGMKIGQYPYDTTQFEFRTRPALALPMPHKPTTKNPSAADLKKAGLVWLANPKQESIARANGWSIWYWDGTWFAPAYTPLPSGTRLYAANAWRTKKPA